MRKVLNVLESCSLNYKQIEVNTIYEVTGRPTPDDINDIFKALNKLKFNDALAVIQSKKETKSLALEDILGELHVCVMSTQYTDPMKIYLVKRMAEIEHRLAVGAQEKAQIASLVGAFIEVRSM